jgi:hypothetical protein
MAIKETVDALKERIEKPRELTFAAPAPETISEEPSIPVPLEYRNIVDTVLNNNFGIQIMPHSDRPSFTFTVVVPDEYSNMSAPYKEMYKIDLRPKVISYADGLNGVRSWCELVYNNLNPEIRSKVTEDRARLVNV